MVILLSCFDCLPPETGSVQADQIPDGLTQASTASDLSAIGVDPGIQPSNVFTQTEFTSEAQRLSTAGSAPTPENHSTPEWLGSASTSKDSQPLLRLGSRGDAVATLQTQLQQAGHYTDRVDGMFGRRTQAAVMAWQRSHNLSPDGIVGPATWATLPPTPTKTFQPPKPSPNLSPSPAPSPSPSSRPTPPPLPFDDTASPPYALWLLGWAIAYGSGWVVIIRDATGQRRERRGKQGNGEARVGAIAPESPPTVPVAAPPSESDTDALPSTPMTPPIAPSVPPLVPNPVASPTFALPAPDLPISEDDLPATPPLEEATGEEIPIPLANDGQLQPHDYLFPYLDEQYGEVSNIADEQVVARLPAPASDLGEEAFQYSLVDLAEDLFILRGNELRVLKSRLEKYGNHISKTVTIRRTSHQGNYVDKSFHLTIGKTA